MAVTIAEIMTPDPVAVSPDTTVAEAARLMSEADTGNVVVVDGQDLVGIVTDRDITTKVVARGRNLATPVRHVCGEQTLVTLTPDATIDAAAQVMREQALRRLPVVEDRRVVGIVSIGDLARERDPGSALADISAAAPNA
jgi:CBS domain-containing protein